MKEEEKQDTIEELNFDDIVALELKYEKLAETSPTVAQMETLDKDIDEILTALKVQETPELRRELKKLEAE